MVGCGTRRSDTNNTKEVNAKAIRGNSEASSSPISQTQQAAKKDSGEEMKYYST